MTRSRPRTAHEMKQQHGPAFLQCARPRCSLAALSMATISLVICLWGAPIAQADSNYASSTTTTATNTVTNTNPAQQSYRDPDPYTIHADDELQVQVFGTQGFYTQTGQPASNTIPALSQTLTVLSDGKITYPLVGSISVAGLRPEEAAQRISSALTKFVIHPVVSVLVVKGKQRKVEVLGSVEHGGQFELERGDRLVDVLDKAGVGPGTNADLNHVTVNRVVDGTPTLYNVNVYNLLLNGDYSADPLLQAGDVIYVPKAKQHNLPDPTNLLRVFPPVVP
jgi:protein involved in polysaccharide export with SLBB domain